MSAALWVRKYWRIATARLRVKAVTGDLGSAVTRGTHVTRSLCLPKSLSSWSFLPVKTPSALWSRGKAEGSKSPRSSEIGVCVGASQELLGSGWQSPGLSPCQFGLSLCQPRDCTSVQKMVVSGLGWGK